MKVCWIYSKDQFWKNDQWSLNQKLLGYVKRNLEYVILNHMNEMYVYR